jgi:hypothetical protein
MKYKFLMINKDPSKNFLTDKYYRNASEALMDNVNKGMYKAVCIYRLQGEL